MIINSIQNFSCQLPFQIREIQTRKHRFRTNNTPFCNQTRERKPKNTKGRRRRLDQMTSKNQMRRVTDFKCPSIEFPLSRIGEEKAADWFQALNSKSSKKRKEGIKSEQKGVYFSGGSMSKVKGSIIESQSNSASKKQGF
jgi:hypothetical protein